HLGGVETAAVDEGARGVARVEVVDVRRLQLPLAGIRPVVTRLHGTILAAAIASSLTIYTMWMFLAKLATFCSGQWETSRESKTCRCAEHFGRGDHARPRAEVAPDPAPRLPHPRLVRGCRHRRPLLRQSERGLVE